MKTVIKYTTLVFILIASYQVQAQQIPVLNQYVFNPYLYNPARAGAEDLGNVYLNHRQQWTSLPDAPVTSTATFDMPLKDMKSGLGAVLVTDKMHIINKVGASLAYSYRFRLGDRDDHFFSMGVAAGFLNQRIDFSDASIQDPSDAVLFNTDQNRTTFDLGAGLHYRVGRFNLDFSVPQLANNKINYLDQNGAIRTNYDLISHYMGTIRYKFLVGKEKKFGIEPLGTIRAAVGLPVQADAFLNFDWNDALWFGAGYRTVSAGLMGNVGFRLHKSFMVSYTYEMMLNESNRNSLGGSHEFMLGFRFGKKVKDLKRRMDDLEVKVAKNEMRIDSLKGYIDDVDLKTKQNERRIDDNADEIGNLNKRVEKNEIDIDVLNDEVDDMRAQRGLLLQKVKIGSVYFLPNSFEVTEQAKVKLRNIKEVIMSKGIRVRVDIGGYASEEGKNVPNQLLSNRRSLAVRDYLIQIGTNPVMLMPIPYGEEDPVTENQDKEEERAANRRVDIYIISE